MKGKCGKMNGAAILSHLHSIFSVAALHPFDLRLILLTMHWRCDTRATCDTSGTAASSGFAAGKLLLLSLSLLFFSLENATVPCCDTTKHVPMSFCCVPSEAIAVFHALRQQSPITVLAATVWFTKGTCLAESRRCKMPSPEPWLMRFFHSPVRRAHRQRVQSVQHCRKPRPSAFSATPLVTSGTPS